mgnify:CR=1 FL=1
MFLLVRSYHKLIIKTSKQVVFILDKMNMKNTISNFRQFARERRKIRIMKTKMASFIVKYQKGESPQLENVTVTVEPSAIFFRNSNDEGFSFVDDRDIEAFDDTELMEVTLFLRRQADIQLVFREPIQQEAFITALVAFLGHR